MTQRLKQMLLLGSLLLINFVTWLVTSGNQKDGIYPIDADSIGMPIMFTAFVSLLVAPILLAIGFLLNKDFVERMRSKGLGYLLAVRVALILLYIGAFWFVISGFLHWYFPNHYLISASYLPLFVFLIVALVWER